MLKKLLFCSIFAFLFTSFPSRGQESANANGGLGAWAGSGAGGCMGSAINSSADVGIDAVLKAAMCELDVWNTDSRVEKNALLIEKAEILSDAGENERAYNTICRIPLFSLSSLQRSELTYKKLQYAYSAGLFSDFAALLDEAIVTETLREDDSNAISEYLSTHKAAQKSEDWAMILSVLPGVGNAYSADWANAARYFFTEGAIIALGVGAFSSGLYLSTFMGGGMLLYKTLPQSTSLAVNACKAYNAEQLRIFYEPVYNSLSQATIVSSTSGAMVSSISLYSETSPVSQCWNK